MFDQIGTSPIAIERRWRFKVQGLDCQNEVRVLREALIPLVGDERFLSFQPKLGLLDVDVASGLTVEAVIAAISTTGMTAELDGQSGISKDAAGADD